jgi:hypothetical protein
MVAKALSMKSLRRERVRRLIVGVPAWARYVLVSFNGARIRDCPERGLFDECPKGLGLGGWSVVFLDGPFRVRGDGKCRYAAGRAFL